MSQESEHRAARARSGPLLALAALGARYWVTVAPLVRAELTRWERAAREIPDTSLRALASGKLAEEAFNAEAGATLATLAPAEQRPAVVSAIVALELLFDYLDGRTEQPSEDPLADGQALFRAFLAAVAEPASQSTERHASGAGSGEPDLGYMLALSGQTQAVLAQLPAREAVREALSAASERCAQAQTRFHAAATLGDGQLETWARSESGGSGLGWREYAAGSAGSVVAMHALIAAAADPATTAADARALDEAYLATGALVTLLDGLIDAAQDGADGHAGLIRLYEPGEREERLRALTRQALARAQAAPHAAHHTMTLAGVGAYYTSAPGASSPGARAISRSVRRELSPTIWPALAFMKSWRAAKRARATITAAPRDPATAPAATRGA